MPFTPKFVDMVRNLTTSTGTGAITLGSAVIGCTSLSAAVATGEQFYYCIQGVEKPAEREVGRGTMQANGTIARDPISGPLINFTSGTKTIALVTAAEWFAKIEQSGGGAGVGGANAVVSGLTELAALPTVNGAAALLTAPGREGLFVFDNSNLSAMVTADARQGIYVAPDSAPTGATGAWVRKFDGAMDIRWFLSAARIPFVTDDLVAFNGALAVIKALAGNGGRARLLVPGGKYYCSGTLNLHVPVHLLGDGSMQGANGTVIRFGKNANGIVVNKGNTDGDGLGTQGDATGSTIEGMQLFGGNVNVNGAGVVTSYAAGDSTSGHGVRVRATFVTLIDVFAACFGGSGFHIVCTAGSGGSTEGNANDFYVERCQGIYNRRFGYEVAGSDSNAGTFNTCSAISNGGGGFIEYSFLGNTYIQCHTRDNGNVDPVGSNGPVGACLYAGEDYYVVAGQEVAASTTVPGTNPAVWAPGPFNIGASKPWVTGLTWVNPSPYGTNPANGNGRNVFLGCYAEGNQAPCQATYPTLFLGGLLDEVKVVGSATWMRGSNQGGMIAGDFVSTNPLDETNRTIFGSPDGRTIFDHARTGGGNAKLRGRSDFFGKKAIDLILDNAFEAYNIGIEPTHPYGYGTMTIARLLVGNGGVNSAIRIGCANDPAVDFAGQAIQLGSLFFKQNPVVGGSAGWVCTTAGLAGSTAVFAELGPVGAKEATNAEAWAGASQNRFVSPRRLFEAAAPVALTDGATVTIDGSTGINFNLTLGGNRTLANPANMKPGQSGRIRVSQDATGSRTLSFGANWLFAGGDPTLSTAANAIDVIAYFANTANEIEASIIKALA